MIVKTIRSSAKSNCNLIGSESSRKGLIIDPVASAEEVVKAVEKLGLDVSLMVATHSHIDHVYAARALKEKLGASFALHEAERNLEHWSPG